MSEQYIFTIFSGGFIAGATTALIIVGFFNNSEKGDSENE